MQAVICPTYPPSQKYVYFYSTGALNKTECQQRWHSRNCRLLQLAVRRILRSGGVPRLVDSGCQVRCEDKQSSKHKASSHTICGVRNTRYRPDHVCYIAHLMTAVPENMGSILTSLPGWHLYERSTNRTSSLWVGAIQCHVRWSSEEQVHRLPWQTNFTDSYIFILVQIYL